jgi:NADPH:quinone reductase-like Zn-dependent oxidoreductase
VIGTASAGKHAWLLGLGADELIDYRTQDFATATGDIDVVVDSIGGDYADRSVGVLRPGGLFLTLVARSDRALAARVEAAGRRFAGITVEPDHVGLEGLAALADAGQLAVHVQQTFPLEKAAEAHALLTTTNLTGKLILTL